MSIGLKRLLGVQMTIILLFLLGGLVACQPGEAVATLSPDLTTHAQELWQASPHAETYVLAADGTNSTCARCHAPINFVPTLEDIPEGCLTCKFEVEPPPPLIVEEEWSPIECRVCHETTGSGDVQAGYAWLEIAQIDEYAAVESTTELCQKCHTAYDSPDHIDTDILVEGAHEDMPCTDCHDAHDTASSCSTEGCHVTLEESDTPVAGHDDEHQAVSCEACHDAGGMDVGPSEEDDGTWLTFDPGSLDEAGNPMSLSSHNIQLETDCERCHFADNPWDLLVEVEGAPES